MTESCLSLPAQPGTVNKKAPRQQTALTLAVDHGGRAAGCVRLLLESGAHPETVNEDGETPLYKGKQCVCVLKTLLDWDSVST